jgi:Flp pilus assembly pilin Flp/predicted nucleic acid-binding Zn ribbon protein
MSREQNKKEPDLARACIICGKPLTRRQGRACSHRCAAECQRFTRRRNHLVQGYRLIPALYSPRTDGGQFEHRVIAERVLGGPLPKGAVVHHHDENTLNNSNQNLVICQSRTYHMLLHARMRVLAAGADPNTHKICDSCEQPLPLDAFGTNPTKYQGRDQCCLKCRRAQWKESTMNRKLGKQAGVTAVEYAIMLVLIAIAVAVAAPSISDSILSVFGKTSSVLDRK